MKYLLVAILTTNSEMKEFLFNPYDLLKFVMLYTIGHDIIRAKTKTIMAVVRSQCSLYIY